MKGGIFISISKCVKEFADTYCGDFEYYLLNQEKSDGTIVYYEYYLYHIMKDFSRKPCDDFSDISKLEILQYIRKLQATNISPRTVNKYIATLNLFFRYKGIDMHFKYNKIQSLQFLENVITDSEAKALMNYLKVHDKDSLFVLVSFLYGTGVRISEALKVKANQINQKTITVTGKGKSRKIFLSDSLRAILQNYVSKKNISGYLWDDIYGHDTNYDNRALAINKSLKYYGAKVGIDKSKLHCHSFRHLFCLRLLDAGLSVNVVASIVGHSNISTTMLYLKKSESELFEIFNKMA